MNQTSAMPTRKVSAGALGGALASIGAWLLAEFAGVNMPPGTEAAFAVLIGTALAYFVPEKG